MDHTHVLALVIGLGIGIAGFTQGNVNTNQLQEKFGEIKNPVQPTFPQKSIRNLVNNDKSRINVSLTGVVHETYQENPVVSDGGYEITVKKCNDYGVDFREGVKIKLYGEYLQTSTSTGQNHYLLCRKAPKIISRP